MNGEAFNFDPLGTIGCLKAKICEKFRLTVDEMFLLHNGKSLKDGCTIQDYNIQNHTTLDLSIRLKAGGNGGGDDSSDGEYLYHTLTCACISYDCRTILLHIYLFYISLLL